MPEMNSETPSQSPTPDARRQWKPRVARAATATTAVVALVVAVAQPAFAGPLCGC